MAINKVIYGGRTLIDLSGDTVTADKILDGFTAHDKKGETITGTCKYDVDSSDATAAVAEILQGKTAYVRGKKLTGTMKNNSAFAIFCNGEIARISTILPTWFKEKELVCSTNLSVSVSNKLL